MCSIAISGHPIAAHPLSSYPSTPGIGIVHPPPPPTMELPFASKQDNRSLEKEGDHEYFTNYV